MDDESSAVSQTRAAYDTVASAYADLLRTELSSKPVDRALLAVFAELVEGRGGGRVADLGCGPGRVGAFLSGLGVDALGVDVSGEMLKVAHRDHPHLEFAQGQLSQLPLADNVLAGAVAWYSIIHTLPSLLPEVFAEFTRVLTPGAPLLVAFQVGDGPVNLSRAYDHDISLIAWRLDPSHVCDLLTEAGFAIDARVVRAWVEPNPCGPKTAEWRVKRWARRAPSR